jgi:hypothetical protein
VNNIGSVPTPSLASVRVIWCGNVGIVGLPLTIYGLGLLAGLILALEHLTPRVLVNL